MSLDTLGLCPSLLKATKELGYTKATPIQTQLIPAILQGRDILAGAHTGTGKTAAFLLPALELNKSNNKTHYPKILVLVPTKELAHQVHQNTKNYAKYTNLTPLLICGGKNSKTQSKALKNGVDIIIATTGKLIEHIENQNISLDAINTFIIDEADTMLDMGFLPQINLIASKLPQKRQNILISATLTKPLKGLSIHLLSKPLTIELNRAKSINPNIDQSIYPVTQEKKDELLTYLIGSKNYQKVLLFVRKKELVPHIEKELNDSGLKSSSIHSYKTTAARAKAIQLFNEQKIRVLVATDIAARGLDIQGIDAVINYDIPHVLSDYIHRIGRTGRAGTKGVAITLISQNEQTALLDLERLLGKKIPAVYLEEYAPPKSKEQNIKVAKAKTKPKKTNGAFGNKKHKPPTKKKRKTTKRDGWKR